MSRVVTHAELLERIRVALHKRGTAPEVIDLILQYPGAHGVIGVARVLGVLDADEVVR